MKIPGITHFELEELVDPVTFRQYGANSIWFLNMPMVKCLDRLRIAIGPITINNWMDGGPLDLSGLRPPDCKIGAFRSQHKRGGAFDTHPQHITPQELFEHIMHDRTLYPEITAIEDIAKTPGWLHIDNRWTNQADILIVEPN